MTEGYCKAYGNQKMSFAALRLPVHRPRIRNILGEDYPMFIVVVAAFFTLMLAMGGGIIYVFSPPSHGQAQSTSEQFVPVQNTRDWRGSLPTDKL